MNDTKRPFPLDQFAGGVFAVGYIAMEVVKWIAYKRMIAEWQDDPIPEANPLLNIPAFLALTYLSYGVYRSKLWAFNILSLTSLSSVIYSIVSHSMGRESSNWFGIEVFYYIVFFYCVVRSLMAYSVILQKRSNINGHDWSE